jgi:hypothetical protein
LREGYSEKRLSRALMNRWYFPLLVCISLLQGCSEPCKSISFESWGVVDTVVMQLPGEREKRTLTDPVVIQAIRAFVQARKDRWEVPFPDTPMPPMTLDLYHGDRGISHLGIGRTFIEAPGCDYVVSRKITSAELHEILRILDLPESALQTR